MNLPPSYTGVYMLRWHNEECVVCCPRGTALQEEHQSVEKDFTFYQQGRHFLHWFWFQSQGLTGSGLRLRVASLGSIYLLMFEAIRCRAVLVSSLPTRGNIFTPLCIPSGTPAASILTQIYCLLSLTLLSLEEHASLI